MAYGYDPNVDYQKLIHQDLMNQDYRSAAIHEAQRNEKIQGEGASQYQTTNLYSDWLPLTDQVNTGLQQLQQAKFEYNPETDPSYQAYRKEALREADRQTRDVLGGYAGMTGGVPSTAAVTAAQQAGNYQRSRLTDKLPELYQQAYGRFSDEQQRLYQNIGLLDNIDQERWRMSQEEQNQGRDNAFNLWTQLGYANDYVSQILGVPVGTLTSSQEYQQWGMAQQEAQQAQQQQDQAYANALNLWTSLGYANDYVASVLGVPVGTLTSAEAYQQWYMKTNGGQNGSGSGGGSGGHGGSVAMGPGTNSEGGGSANAGASNHTPVPVQMGGPSEEELAAAAAEAGMGSGYNPNPNPTGGKGLPKATYNGLVRTIKTFLQQGKYEEAAAVAMQYKKQLSDEQYAWIDSLINSNP
jgi:hypothetical protein